MKRNRTATERRVFIDKIDGRYARARKYKALLRELLGYFPKPTPADEARVRGVVALVLLAEAEAVKFADGETVDVARMERLVMQADRAMRAITQKGEPEGPVDALAAALAKADNGER